MDNNIQTCKFTKNYLRNKFLSSFLSSFQKDSPSESQEDKLSRHDTTTVNSARRATPNRVSKPTEPRSLPKPVGSRLKSLNSPLKTVGRSRRFGRASSQPFHRVKKQMDSFHNILSFNACGLSALTITDLKRFHDLNDVDIICIQETKFKDKIIRKIPGYTLENKIFKNDKRQFLWHFSHMFQKWN